MKNNLLLYVCLVVLSILPLLDLAHPGMPQTHDGQDHVSRIANFYQNLQEGNVVPRWAPNLNNGYGHPILMFLYPLPSYSASLFHFIGFSFTDSTKLLFSASAVLSVLAMFIWLKEFLPKHAAFIGALLYLYAPYRFVDLYVRGALGECVAFVFPPLVLYFLLKLAKKYSYKNLFMGSCSFACLILAHNAISLMFLPIIILYSAFLIWQSKTGKQLAIVHFILLIAGFGLSAFFWLPAFIEGKYTLRDIAVKGGYLDDFTTFPKLLYGPWSYGISGEFTVQAGILQWIGVILAIPLAFYFYKKKNKLWILTAGFLIIFMISLFLVEKSSMPVWEKISIIQKFQFPWRFLSVTVFAGSVLGALVVSLFNKKNKIMLTLVLTLAILFLNKDYWHAAYFFDKPEIFYTSINSRTTDTGESAPIWSVRFMEEKPKAPIEVIDGKALVTQEKRTITLRKYKIISNASVGLRENTLYFPGWHVLVNGRETDIQFQDANSRGLITFNVPKGTSNVEIKFTETKLRHIADIISIITFAFLIIAAIYNMSNKRKKLK